MNFLDTFFDTYNEEDNIYTFALDLCKKQTTVTVLAVSINKDSVLLHYHNSVSFVHISGAAFSRFYIPFNFGFHYSVIDLNTIFNHTKNKSQLSLFFK